jgi:hypothetical protein
MQRKARLLRLRRSRVEGGAAEAIMAPNKPAPAIVAMIIVFTCIGRSFGLGADLWQLATQTARQGGIRIGPAETAQYAWALRPTHRATAEGGLCKIEHLRNETKAEARRHCASQPTEIARRARRPPRYPEPLCRRQSNSSAHIGHRRETILRATIGRRRQAQQRDRAGQAERPPPNLCRARATNSSGER